MIVTVLISIVTGLVFAIIINYLADVLPAGGRIGKVYCRQCGTAHRYNTYLLLQKCRNCGKDPLRRSNLVIIFMLVASGIIVYLSPESILKGTIDLVVLSFLVLITVIDIEHHLVLHVTSLAGVILFGAIGIYTNGLVPALMGGGINFLVMFLIFIAGHFYSAYKTKKIGIEMDDAIGFGDVTFSGVAGLLLGWPYSITAIIFGIIAGGAWSIGYLVYSLLKKKDAPLGVFIAYAPFIALATGVLWFLLH